MDNLCRLSFCRPLRTYCFSLLGCNLLFSLTTPVVQWRSHSPSLPPCLFYADSVRRGGDTQQTLRKRKKVDTFVVFLFVAPQGLLLLSVGL